MRAKRLMLTLLLCLAGRLFATNAWADDALAARRSQIEQMSPAEQQELLRRQERFSALPADEQQRLRELEAAVDADPHAQQLHMVLRRYHEWLKTLTPTQREELADLAPEERIKQIKKIQRQQRISHEAELLTPKDFREISRWCEDIVWANREQYLANTTVERRKQFEQSSPQKQRYLLLHWAQERGRQAGQRSMAIVQTPDIERLASKLSPAAQEQLAKSTDLAAQRKLVAGWIAIVMHRMESWQSGRRPPRLMDEDLVQFFEKELRPEQRESLLKMPREQMLDEVRRMYFARERADGEFGPGHGPPPWPREMPRGYMPKGDRSKGPRRFERPATSPDDSKQREPKQDEPSAKPAA